MILLAVLTLKTLLNCVMLPCMFFSFAGFFRFDDVPRIRRNDIFFNKGFMVIKVPKSKNDQLRRGDEVVISELPSPACPVKLLKKYFTKLQIPPDSRDLILDPFLRARILLS